MRSAPMPAALASPLSGADRRRARRARLGRGAQRSEIIAALESLGRSVVRAYSLDDAEAAIGAHPALSCAW